MIFRNLQTFFVRRFLLNSHIYFLAADLALGVTELQNMYLVFSHPLVIAQGGSFIS